MKGERQPTEPSSSLLVPKAAAAFFPSFPSLSAFAREMAFCVSWPGGLVALKLVFRKKGEAHAFLMLLPFLLWAWTLATGPERRIREFHAML